MSLIKLAETDPTVFEGYGVQQIVAICGDGQLLDGSECSLQFRKFLSFQKGTKLAQYAEECIDATFPKSGAVLQDIVNEIGRRLGYEVINGRYSGTPREIGFDGLWREGEAALVVEVKTTDTYRINLDTLVTYATRAKSEGLCETEPKVLLVVGRQDTGDLEAQVRGSRHAWQVRLVSISSLLKLMFVRAEISERTFAEKVRRILFPFEYTRVDDIIDLVFETQREVEEKLVDAEEAVIAVEEERRTGSWQFTPTTELDAKRDQLLARFYSRYRGGHRKVTRGKYINDELNIRVACSISKRYPRDYQPYWYAFHPAWLEFLDKGAESFFILGCMDREEGFAIPLDVVKQQLDKLNKTEKEDRYYWHIALSFDDKGVFLNMSKTGERLYLSQYEF